MQARGHRSTLRLDRLWMACVCVGSMKWAGGPSQHSMWLSARRLRCPLSDAFDDGCFGPVDSDAADEQEEEEDELNRLAAWREEVAEDADGWWLEFRWTAEGLVAVLDEPVGVGVLFSVLGVGVRCRCLMRLLRRRWCAFRSSVRLRFTWLPPMEGLLDMSVWQWGRRISRRTELVTYSTRQ